MTDNRPVIIVGAPRSGTSLMQKLVRESPGFVSVPKESDMIWLPYCDPARNDWQYEGCPDARITDEAVSDIRSAFKNQALSAATWRLFDQLRIMERPALAGCLRLAYRSLYKPWRWTLEKVRTVEPTAHRLVDKSVHAGLWLNLLDAVFPNALYIHMIRSPATCIPSMVRGWQLHTRFRTYRVPESVSSPREDTSGWWCFPMPAGWHEYYHRDLPSICAFQWDAINKAILRGTSAAGFADRVIRIHLEDLSSSPSRVLERISAFSNIALPSTSNTTLPVVNALDSDETVVTAAMRRAIETTEDTYKDLSPAD